MVKTMSHYSESDYAPAPFWFLNHKLEKDELKRQIKLMKDAGVGGFFMHPRAGLETPYGSDEWFDLTEFIAGEAEKLGLRAWLYDEDPFPSGAAGGRIFCENPEFAARQIVIREISPDADGSVSADIGNGKALEAAALREDADGNILETRDISDNIGMIRPNYFMSRWENSYYAQITGKVMYPHFRAETFNSRLRLECRLPDKSWRVFVSTAETVVGDEKFGFIPDNLNPDCVKLFIELTHEKYFSRLKDKFGKTIPGIFTDEPAAGGSLPWTAKLEETFLSLNGYELRGKYHFIRHSSAEEARKARRDYWRTVHHLFEESFFKPLGKWCRKRSVVFCGHCIAEEEPLVMTNVYSLQKYFGVPGFDHITLNIPDGKFCSLNLGGKLISSAANQQGKRMILSECFACNPFNFGDGGMKKIANWLYSLGITWLVPHGFYYSYDGYRKYDAGKSFFFQDTEFRRFPAFAAYARRTGFKLGESDSLNHVCVMHPVAAFRSLFPAERAAAENLRERLYRCVQDLIERHAQFDLTDDETLLRAPVSGGKIRVGRMRYDTVVNPCPTDLLGPEILKRLDSLRAAGLKVIDFGESFDEIPCGAGLLELVRLGSCALEKQCVTVKKSRDGILAYIFNNSSHPGLFEIKFKGRRGGVFFYDAGTGLYSEIKEHDGRRVFAVRGFEAVILEFRKKALSCPEYKIPAGLKKAEFRHEAAPEWDYTPPCGCAAAIHRWDIKVSGPCLEAERKEEMFSLTRDIIGTELPHIKNKTPRPIFDRSAPAPSLYPVRAAFSAEFVLSPGTVTNPLLVFERDTVAGECRILINGAELDKAKIQRRRIYDPWNMAAEIKEFCRPGRNTIQFVWKKAGEFDGLRSAVYVISADAAGPGG
jgi:hypothetical protein